MDWDSVIDQYEQELLFYHDEASRAYSFPRLDRPLRQPPADDGEIAGVEQRLRISLPASYRAFLSRSAGWGATLNHLRLLGPSELRWYRDGDQQSIDAWISGSGGLSAPDDLYFVYGREQDCVHIRDEYLESMLLLSDSSESDGAALLLNPEIVTDEGEWEVWDFSPTNPGADRYQSFGAFILAELERANQMARDLQR